MKYNYTLLFLILIYGSIKGQNIDSKFALSNANKSYDIGDYVSSIEKYNSANKLDTSNNISMFNAGNAAFMKGEFEEANSYYENYYEPEAGISTNKIVRTPQLYGNALINYTPNKKWDFNLSAVLTGKMYVPHVAGYVTNTSLEETPTMLDIGLNTGYTIFSPLLALFV